MELSNLLDSYKSKRNFDITPEPADGGIQVNGLQFVIQKHWASSLHYDFRLEFNGVMKSWAVPKGPSYDPKVKRMAMHVEDHPLAYASFEGTIPLKQYGAGKVIVWDKGIWEPVGDPEADFASGNLKFELKGIKLHGKWVLVRIKGKSEKQQPWLLIKEKDSLAKPAEEFSIVDEYPDSVNELPFPEREITSKNIAEADNESIDEILSHTPKADLSEFLKPQLATLAEGVNAHKNWIAEIKFDGYRLLIRKDKKDIKFFTRNGNDWTNKLPELKQKFLESKLPSGWYDGEIVVPNAKGVPDFGALQQSFESSKSKNIVLYLFDVVYFKGYDLRALPLISRRAILTKQSKHIISDCIRLSEVFEASAGKLLKSACQLGLEGIILKNPDSPYLSSRSANWLKLKCKQSQEFVIIGYTPPNGARSNFGALLLAIYDENGLLKHAGNVGSGFTKKTLTDIKLKLDAIKMRTSAVDKPFVSPPKTTWVEPVLVAEVEFGEWTASGHIRHSVFKGLRTDKDPKTIIREVPNVELLEEEAEPTQAIKKPTTVKVTNPSRIIDPTNGITKLDVVRYYQSVSDLMFQHLNHRLVSLLRAPSGLNGEMFFQKHAETEKLTGVKKIQQDNDKLPMIEINKKDGLASAAQWNVIEFHTHNGNQSLDLPDRIIFDLDPGENVNWEKVKDAAQLMKAFLSQLNLPAFLKTSGGKGLHVVVPLQKEYDWDTVKAFTQAVVVHMSKTIPSRFVAKSGPKNRVGKIFIDYLRNGQDATTVSAWSLRARAGMGVSVPVDWEELTDIRSGDHWNLRNVHSRLQRGNEPWKQYEASATDISDAMKLLKT